MKQIISSTAALLLLAFCVIVAEAATQAPKKPAGKKAAANKQKPAEDATGEEALKSRLDAIKDLPVAERIGVLEEIVAAAPAESPSRVRAAELLSGARAALGDEKLRSGDSLGGVELFKQIVGEVTNETSDKLFVEIISRLPANLYALGHREEAIELARRVEEKAAGSARRLLSVAGFYLSVEQGDDAARAAESAVKLAPDNASAHQMLGVAHRMALRLDKAAEEYARALELDPASAASRRSLADLRRATGRSEEAVGLYRELLAADPKDAGARAGLVLALFDAGKEEEGERELTAALEAQPENLPLLVGATYHFAARGDGARAADFAGRAVNLESRARWVWARLAYARALLAQKRPLEAEGAVRLAGELGRFPTLDYDLATALAASGFYEEAAETLAKSFALKEGRLETYLAGRTHASADDFQELLAPELRASTFQHRGADTAGNARLLKALLAFHLATRLGATDERRAVEAAREFTAGDDEMRTFRQLYVANKLLERGAALGTVVEQTDEAMGGVEAALDAPVGNVALLADELREARARARAARTAVTIPALPRDTLSKILRGRIEDLAGWALYNQGNYAEAAVRLKRAASVLPENTFWWRAAQWHLGAALDSSGSQREALAAYVRAYRLAPEPARRPIIEELYRRLNNGSDAGLERLLSAPAATASASPSSEPAPPFNISNRQAERAVEVPSEIGARAGAPKQGATPTPTAEQAAGQAVPQTTASPQPEETARRESAPPSTTEMPAPEAPKAEPTSSAKDKTTDAAKPEEVKPEEKKAEPPKEDEPRKEETKSETAPTETPKTETKPPDPSPLPTPTPPTAPESEKPAQTEVEEPKAEQESDKPAIEAAKVSPMTPAGAAAAKRKRRAEGCTLSVSESAVSLNTGGGSATVSVSLEGAGDLSKLTAATPNWADIVILAEPRAPEATAQKFTLSSVSGKAGTFTAVFKSPCGKREVQVEVK